MRATTHTLIIIIVGCISGRFCFAGPMTFTQLSEAPVELPLKRDSIKIGRYHFSVYAENPELMRYRLAQNILLALMGIENLDLRPVFVDQNGILSPDLLIPKGRYENLDERAVNSFSKEWKERLKIFHRFFQATVDGNSRSFYASIKIFNRRSLVYLPDHIPSLSDISVPFSEKVPLAADRLESKSLESYLSNQIASIVSALEETQQFWNFFEWLLPLEVSDKKKWSVTFRKKLSAQFPQEGVNPFFWSNVRAFYSILPNIREPRFATESLFRDWIQAEPLSAPKLKALADESIKRPFQFYFGAVTPAHSDFDPITGWGKNLSHRALNSTFVVSPNDDEGKAIMALLNRLNLNVVSLDYVRGGVGMDDNDAFDRIKEGLARVPDTRWKYMYGFELPERLYKVINRHPIHEKLEVRKFDHHGIGLSEENYRPISTLEQLLHFLNIDASERTIMTAINDRGGIESLRQAIMQAQGRSATALTVDHLDFLPPAERTKKISKRERLLLSHAGRKILIDVGGLSDWLSHHQPSTNAASQLNQAAQKTSFRVEGTFRAITFVRELLASLDESHQKDFKWSVWSGDRSGTAYFFSPMITQQALEAFVAALKNALTPITSGPSSACAEIF